MRIQFLETSAVGLAWMKAYYGEQIQLDAGRVYESFDAALENLKQSPRLGQRFDGFDNVRELQIVHSPFSILYTVKGEAIYIIDVRDGRGTRSAEALATFNGILRKKYNL